MRILTVLTYYSPHISGLTIYARRLARRLVARGHEVTVLTSHFRPDLPLREVIDGATVVRSPVLTMLSKAAIMPLYLWDAGRLLRTHDIAHLHLPQFEASGAALLARAMRKPVVATYHCDIELPPGLVRTVFTPAVRASHYAAGKLAQTVVVNSQEFAAAARLPRRFHQKVVCVYPPIELPAGASSGTAFRERRHLGDGPLVGFVGRFAEEKGIRYLLEAVPQVLAEVPDARFVLAGPTDSVPGERVHEQLRPLLHALGGAVMHVGLLSDAELADLYGAIDVLVLASTNSTESFGMTQAEAMLAGTPVVATDIPGVRETVRVTGMGVLVPPADAPALARGIVSVLRDRERLARGRDAARDLFDPEKTADFYDALFAGLLARSTGAPTAAPTRHARGR